MKENRVSRVVCIVVAAAITLAFVGSGCDLIGGGAGSVALDNPAGSANLTNATPAPPPFPFDIVPYEYTLEDREKGWKRGTVGLAFENTGVDVAWGIPQIDLPAGAVVYTKEGPTYPATLYDTCGSSPWIAVDKIYAMETGPIPRGFRFATAPVPDRGSSCRHAIKWNSASAATPETIHFPDHPELSFALPVEQGASIQFPFDYPPIEVSSFSDLEGTDLVNDPEGVRATFTGRCDCGDYRHAAFLDLQFENNDKFYERAAEFVFGHTNFIPEGRFGHEDGQVDPVSGGHFARNGSSPWEEHGPGQITLGPGESGIGGIYLFSSGTDPSYILTWGDDSEFALYDVSECSSE